MTAADECGSQSATAKLTAPGDWTDAAGEVQSFGGGSVAKRFK